MVIWIILAPFCIIALISLKCHARSSLLIIKDDAVVGNLASCNMIVIAAVSRNNLRQRFVSQVHAPWLFSLLTFRLWRLSLFVIFKNSFTRLFSVSDFHKTPLKTKTKTIQHRYLGIWDKKKITYACVWPRFRSVRLFHTRDRYFFDKHICWRNFLLKFIELFTEETMLGSIRGGPTCHNGLCYESKN